MALLYARPCENFTIEELVDLQLYLFCRRAEELVGTYHQGDGRAGHSSLAELQKEVEEELKYIVVHPEVTDAVRDGKCASLALSWVHHLTHDTRTEIRAAKISLPLLAMRGSADHIPMLRKKGHDVVADRFEKAVTCEIGHSASAQPAGQWKGFPDWPDEITYNASGYGPYPFWHGGHGGGSLTQGSPITTWWSALKNAERLDHHGKCSLSGLGGINGPCTHLFVNQYAYLFSQDQSFCCISSTPEDVCHLSRPQRDFFRAMNYNGISDGYVSESGYYTGKIKNYSMHLTNPADFWFWYFTDLDDKPLEQGEGPCVLPRGCPGPPKYLFHQYDPPTFRALNISQDVFTIPAICKSSRVTQCEVEPTHFCVGSMI